jgi:hypothetical protein
VDSFTSATCHPLSASQAEKLDTSLLKGPLVTEAFSCAVQAEKERCTNGGGSCEILHDGYYIVNILCVVVGVLTFVMYIQKKVMALQNLPLRAWRLNGQKS